MADVRITPESGRVADIGGCRKRARSGREHVQHMPRVRNAELFDHLVGTAKERQRNCDAEDFRGLEIQDEHILVRTLNR